MSFAELLAEVMMQRGIGPEALSKITGLDRQTIATVRDGKHHPQVSTAHRLAEALDAPELLRLSTEGLQRRCVVCQARFVNTHRDPRRKIYCGTRCQQTAGNRRRTAKRRTDFRTERRHLGEVMSAVARFCGSCEWDGVCKTPTCELREFSPFPLVARRAA